jgi:hypothetical protein
MNTGHQFGFFDHLRDDIRGKKNKNKAPTS